MPTNDNTIIQKAQSWLTEDYDKQTQEEVKRLISSNTEELTNSFYRDLDFGTGGLRGVMGVGTNRMNIYTVRKATQGIANHLKKKYFKDTTTENSPLIKVAITYDSRNNSPLFAQEVANILTGNNIVVYLSEELRPTPWLSFCIRHLECQAGIVITASHNPPEYNGYKVYGRDGGQIIFPEDKEIIEEVNKIASPKETLKRVHQSNQKNDLLFLIGKKEDEAYLNYIKTLSLYKRMEQIKSIENKTSVRVTYTPLHGTGITLMPQAMEAFSIKNLALVEQQIIPDGDFPTVSYPNPEERVVLKLGLEKMESEKSQLLIATDPDSDRVGIAIRDENNNPCLLNGNQTAILLFDYVFTLLKAQGQLPTNGFCCTTIVTTPLIEEIAKHFDVKVYTVLTGFKYIAKTIQEKENKESFIIGAEESYGYLVGDGVRDKDAISSSAILAEMCQYHYDQGSNPYERLIDLYTQYGLRYESLHSITKKGKDGQESIQGIMKSLREIPPKKINNSKIVVIKDYLKQTIQNIKTQKTDSISLPISDVLQFELEDKSLISVRPSGTEPKIKFYVSVHSVLEKKKDYAKIRRMLEEKCKTILSEFG